MKIPAIRANIGTWVYYVAVLRFKDVARYVKKVDNELHNSKFLSDLLQRSITDNFKSIAHYIETQDERFFNALVLAVYDGEPLWHEVRLEYENGEEFYDLGILELSGDENIFPVDGQHRVEGIKKVVEDSDRFNDEQIPVIFISHKTDEAGMQRSRRLFSTLNRYAKPVSMRDIIALDEDDAIAIVSRELIDSHPLFSNERILDSKSKAIPENNTKAFTTIITFYECNRELLWLMLKNRDVVNVNGKKAHGKAKIREYIRLRPSEDDLREYSFLCHSFWNAFVSCFDSIRDYVKNEPDTSLFRNRNGGNLLFRPVALRPFVQVVVRLADATNQSFEQLFYSFPMSILQIEAPLWRNILWNNEKKTMIMNHQKTVEEMLLYFWKRDLMTSKEQDDLFLTLKNYWQMSNRTEIEDVLEDAIQ